MTDQLEVIGTKEVYAATSRPRPGQRVMYLFEPFNQWYVGMYDADADSVFGKNGFTSWEPEVLRWMDATEDGESSYDKHMKEKG